MIISSIASIMPRIEGMKIQHKSLENMLREVVREELQQCGRIE